MNNSSFRKYTKKYYNIAEINNFNSIHEVIDPSTFLNSAVGAAAVGGLMPAAIPAVTGAISMIRDSINKFKYDKFGCKRVIDQISRNDCEARAIDRAITDLRNKMSGCQQTNNPIACKKKIEQEIIKKTQEKVELKNLSVLASTGSE